MGIPFFAMILPFKIAQIRSVKIIDVIEHYFFEFSHLATQSDLPLARHLEAC